MHAVAFSEFSVGSTKRCSIVFSTSTPKMPKNANLVKSARESRKIRRPSLSEASIQPRSKVRQVAKTVEPQPRSTPPAARIAGAVN